jgi:hypothetical protein
MDKPLVATRAFAQRPKPEAVAAGTRPSCEIMARLIKAVEDCELMDRTGATNKWASSHSPLTTPVMSSSSTSYPTDAAHSDTQTLRGTRVRVGLERWGALMSTKLAKVE